MPDTVHVLLPLSLLEAIRSVDTPEGEDVEYVQELRNKRLGLSDTVHAQIRRYGDALKRSQPIAAMEATSLATLIGRRPDAEDIFRSAGRGIARRMYERIPRVTRKMTHVLPSFLARPIAYRRLRSSFAKYLDAALRRSEGKLVLEVKRSATADGAAGSEGCAFYGSALDEMMRLILPGSHSVEHSRCVKNDSGTCEWRADWSKQPKKQKEAAANA
jgi:predicted hydrocarbon binding protein